MKAGDVVPIPTPEAETSTNNLLLPTDRSPVRVAVVVVNAPVFDAPCTSRLKAGVTVPIPTLEVETSTNSLLPPTVRSLVDVNVPSNCPVVAVKAPLESVPLNVPVVAVSVPTFAVP